MIVLINHKNLTRGATASNIVWLFPENFEREKHSVILQPQKIILLFLPINKLFSKSWIDTVGNNIQFNHGELYICERGVCLVINVTVPECPPHHEQFSLQKSL